MERGVLSRLLLVAAAKAEASLARTAATALVAAGHALSAEDLFCYLHALLAGPRRPDLVGAVEALSSSSSLSLSFSEGQREGLHALLVAAIVRPDAQGMDDLYFALVDQANQLRLQQRQSEEGEGEEGEGRGRDKEGLVPRIALDALVEAAGRSISTLLFHNLT
jgi:hypothetical protein